MKEGDITFEQFKRLRLISKIELPYCNDIKNELLRCGVRSSEEELLLFAKFDDMNRTAKTIDRYYPLERDERTK